MTKVKRNYQRAPLIACPHCGAAGQIRRSAQVTPTVRDVTVVCSDDDCACRFVAQIAAIRTIQPSLRPNPAVILPLVTVARPANDDAKVPANDDVPPAAEADPMTT